MRRTSAGPVLTLPTTRRFCAAQSIIDRNIVAKRKRTGAFTLRRDERREPPAAMKANRRACLRDQNL
jgi:hypothetical protein